MEIKIYTTPACSWCQKAKDWLKKNKCSFQELDTYESSTYRDEVLEKSGQMALPVFDIEGTIIVGFQEEELKKVLVKSP